MSKKSIEESLAKLNDELIKAKAEGRKKAVKAIEKTITALKRRKTT